MGYFFGGPHNKDYSILGSILGSPYFGKLPLIVALRVKIVLGRYASKRTSGVHVSI